MSLFRKSWNSKNQQEAVAAVEALTDQKIIYMAAISARDSEARLAAIAKTDIKTLRLLVEKFVKGIRSWGRIEVSATIEKISVYAKQKETVDDAFIMLTSLLIYNFGTDKRSLYWLDHSILEIPNKLLGIVSKCNPETVKLRFDSIYRAIHNWHQDIPCHEDKQVQDGSCSDCATVHVDNEGPKSHSDNKTGELIIARFPAYLQTEQTNT